jgi:hypothetical protein
MNSRSLPARTWLIVLVTAGLLALVPGVAAASTAQEEQEGSQVLGEFEAGKLSCADAGAEDFERVGEYVMGRMLGSTNSHEAMDEVMSRMMGSDNEPQIHEAMGRRFTGCGGGQLPAGFGRMMGAFNAMGAMGGGMMGGLAQGGRSYGPSGSMMGGYWNESAANDEDFDGPSAGAMIGMMAVLIGAVAVAVLFLARRRPGGGPLDTLEQRYARGELSAEEYQERKRLLGGS